MSSSVSTASESGTSASANMSSPKAVPTSSHEFEEKGVTPSRAPAPSWAPPPQTPRRPYRSPRPQLQKTPPTSLSRLLPNHPRPLARNSHSLVTLDAQLVGAHGWGKTVSPPTPSPPPSSPSLSPPSLLPLPPLPPPPPSPPDSRCCCCCRCYRRSFHHCSRHRHHR